jgi:hypothetical protein
VCKPRCYKCRSHATLSGTSFDPGDRNRKGKQLRIENRFPQQIQYLAGSLLFLTLLSFLTIPLAFSQTSGTGNMPKMDMSAPAAPQSAAQAAKLEADQRESEFNHRLSGFFVICAGILILCEGRLAKRWPWVRYAWPMCFLAAGLFVLVFSDTEIWPFGHQTPWFALAHSLEDLQHKIFALILLGLGSVELQRARGRLRSVWSLWFFPATAMAGAILLLFHVHSGDMHAPHAMQTMEHIQEQHRWFAAAGFGVGLASLAARIPQKWQRLFNVTWPALLIVLGVLLTLYTE